MRAIPGSQAVLLTGAILLSVGCPSEKGTSLVRVHVAPVGEAAKVVLWDSEKGLELEEKPAADVTFQVPLERLHAPRVTVFSREGAETTSGKIAPIESSVEVGPLRVWGARADWKRQGDRVRFSWPPLVGPEIPESLRYSLLFVYKSTSGQDLEAGLIAKNRPEAIQTLSELSEIFPDRDPTVKTMTLRIRAYAGDSKEGPIWAGVKQEWPVPDDLPVQQGGR